MATDTSSPWRAAAHRCDGPAMRPGSVTCYLGRASDFGITVVRGRPGTITLQLRGELDLWGSQLFLGVVDNGMPNCPEVVRLDLSALTFCDSSGLDAILAARRCIWFSGSQAEILGTPRCVARLLILLHIDLSVKSIDGAVGMPVWVGDEWVTPSVLTSRSRTSQSSRTVPPSSLAQKWHPLPEAGASAIDDRVCFDLVERFARRAERRSKILGAGLRAPPPPVAALRTVARVRKGEHHDDNR